MSFLTNQFGPMSGVCTKVFLKKVFLLEVLSYSLQLFWTKLSYFSDTSTDREIKDSTEELQFPHLVGGKETTLTWLRNERLQACKEWPYRSLFIRSGIIRKVLLHSCLESSCAQAAPEHNWLCCCHRRMWWLSLSERCPLQSGLLLPHEVKSLPYPLQIHAWYLYSDKH